MQTKIKIIWKVGEVPTGKYRSFFTRSWPSASLENGDAIGLIECVDHYEPSKVQNGSHAELVLKIADRSNPTPETGAFVWRKAKARFKSLNEAKSALVKILEKNPRLLGAKHKAALSAEQGE